MVYEMRGLAAGGEVFRSSGRAEWMIGVGEARSG